jgi:hypothetical protein
MHLRKYKRWMDHRYVLATARLCLPCSRPRRSPRHRSSSVRRWNAKVFIAERGRVRKASPPSSLTSSGDVAQRSSLVSILPVSSLERKSSALSTVRIGISVVSESLHEVGLRSQKTHMRIELGSRVSVRDKSGYLPVGKVYTHRT